MRVIFHEQIQFLAPIRLFDLSDTAHASTRLSATVHARCREKLNGTIFADEQNMNHRTEYVT